MCQTKATVNQNSGNLLQNWNFTCFESNVIVSRNPDLFVSGSRRIYSTFAKFRCQTDRPPSTKILEFYCKIQISRAPNPIRYFSQFEILNFCLPYIVPILLFLHSAVYHKQNKIYETWISHPPNLTRYFSQFEHNFLNFCLPRIVPILLGQNSTT